MEAIVRFPEEKIACNGILEQKFYWNMQKPILLHWKANTDTYEWGDFTFLLTIEASKHMLIVIPSKEGAEEDVALNKVRLQHPEER